MDIVMRLLDRIGEGDVKPHLDGILLTLELNKLEARHQRRGQPAIIERLYNDIGLTTEFRLREGYDHLLREIPHIFDWDEVKTLSLELASGDENVLIKYDVMLATNLAEEEVRRFVPFEEQDQGPVLLREYDKDGFPRTFEINPAYREKVGEVLGKVRDISDYRQPTITKTEIPFDIAELEGMVGRELYVILLGSDKREEIGEVAPLGTVIELESRERKRINGYFIGMIGTATYTDAGAPFEGSSSRNMIMTVDKVQLSDDAPPKLIGMAGNYSPSTNRINRNQRRMELELKGIPRYKTRVDIGPTEF